MKKHQLLMIVGALLLLVLFVFPLWNITLEAPQYPGDGLGMNIFITHFEDVNPHDIKNINLMNHYVGMKYIPDTIPEFNIFPIVIGIMVFLGVLIGLKGNYKLYIVWLVVMCLLGVAGLYDFYLWEYDYGHNLDPKAIMKFTDESGNPMAYQPPLFGSQVILNFTAHSYPRLGALGMFLGLILTFVGFVIGKKEMKTVN